MSNPKKLPVPPDFTHVDELIAAVSPYVRLPHPDVVSAFKDKAVFPAIRDQKKRQTLLEDSDRSLLLDDNTTPRWALLWSHGYGQVAHPKGWTFAHVWARPKDPDCYTHVANIAMMPEYLASLSDKQGPLGAYLRYHSWIRYGWKPREVDKPEEPIGYESVSWSYLQKEADNPKNVIDSRVNALNNKRCELLRSMRQVQR